MESDPGQDRLAAFAEEREALAAVLASSLFVRAPQLARILSYLCEKHFKGEAGDIKAYNIALDALGRAPGFDPQSDAIVRVEIHSLRKRLQKYYAGEGASHRIRIQLLPGQYTPDFIRTEQPAGAVPADSPASEVPAGPTLLRRHRGLLSALSAVLILIAVFLWVRTAGRPAHFLIKAAAPAAPLRTPPAAAAPLLDPDGALRIRSGATAPYVDRLGRIWQPDRFFTGGRPFSASTHVFRTQEPGVFESQRAGDFRYDVPLPPGSYELHLYFAEATYGEGNGEAGGETSRLMNVSANGAPLLSGFDVLADAGAPNTADVRVFKDLQPASDGYLHLAFSDITGKAFLNALEILPGVPGKMLPVRISTREQPYVDPQGRRWDADHYFFGGRQSQDKVTGLTDADNPELYQTQRFGHFSYVIPVASPGRYGVTLFFMENHYTPENPSGPGVRNFDVFCNGIALLRSFKILQETTAAHRPLIKVFHKIPANAQGKLVLSFVPNRDYACVTAIAVADESE